MSQTNSFPPRECVSRSVLVTNISTRASEETIDDFFSFCGTIQQKRIKLVGPERNGESNDKNDPTLEAYVIFENESAQQSALLLSGSTVLDRRVEIKAAPEQWSDTDAAPRIDGNSGVTNGSTNQNGFLSFLPAPTVDALSTTKDGIGGFFGNVGQVLSKEVAKVGDALKESQDHGVLKTARDQAVVASDKTKEAAATFDDKFHVKDKVMNAATVSKSKAQEVADVVTTQTKSIASSVDEKFHVSDKANVLASKAMENKLVADGYNSAVSYWSKLWNSSQTQPTTSNPSPQDATDTSTSNSNTDDTVTF